MATRFAEGRTLDYTPGSAVSAGDEVVVGDTLGFANCDIAAGALGALSIDGVWTVTKVAGAATVDGEIAYRADDGSGWQASAAGATAYGKFVGDQESADTTCNVLLIPGIASGGVMTVTADTTLTAADSGKTISSVGAAGAVAVTLPPAVPGLEFDFYVGAVQELRPTPDGTDVIGLPSTGVAGAAGAYIAADAIGETCRLKCVVAGVWSPMGYAGTWAAQP
ncbi:DUF2190 family protein [Gimesia chilikensis]|uniref:DUF2190 family protein n=1 Tax=Gimesia chilikensis TaxID=2605989 RepID=UPI003A9263F4